MIDYSRISKNLFELRRYSGLTNYDIADRTGLSLGSISCHMNMAKPNSRMTLDSLDKYAEVFGCSINEILEGSIEYHDSPIENRLKDCYPYNFISRVLTESGIEPSDENLYKCYIPDFIEAFSLLTDQEKTVVNCKYKEGIGDYAIGKDLGVDVPRVYQINKTILRNFSRKEPFNKWKERFYSYG